MTAAMARDASSGRAARWALGAASLLLAATAGLHLRGRRELVAGLIASGLGEDRLSILGGLWVSFSLALLAVAAVALVGALRPGSVGRSVLAVCGAFVAAETAMLLVVVGIFAGSVLLGVTALLLFAAIFLRPPRREP